jgi:hypothetical protein
MIHVISLDLENNMGQALKAAVAGQRILLRGLLSGSMTRLATDCAGVWTDREKLQQRLIEGIDALPSCKYLYLLDDEANQITENISSGGLLPEHLAVTVARGPISRRRWRVRPFLCQMPI